MLLGLGVFAVVYVAGITSVSGGVLAGMLAAGGIVSYATAQWISLDATRYTILTGIALVVSVIKNPDGLVGNAHRVIERRRAKRTDRPDADERSIVSQAVRSCGRAHPAAGHRARGARPQGAVRRRRRGRRRELRRSARHHRRPDRPERRGQDECDRRDHGLLPAARAPSSSTANRSTVGRRTDAFGKGSGGPSKASSSGTSSPCPRTFSSVPANRSGPATRSPACTSCCSSARCAIALRASCRRVNASSCRSRERSLRVHRSCCSTNRRPVSTPRRARGWPSDCVTCAMRAPRSLLVDHDMNLVLNLCDHIEVLDFGRIIASGSPAEMRGSSVVADAYLGTTHAAPEVGVS